MNIFDEIKHLLTGLAYEDYVKVKTKLEYLRANKQNNVEVDDIKIQRLENSLEQARLKIENQTRLLNENGRYIHELQKKLERTATVHECKMLFPQELKNELFRRITKVVDKTLHKAGFPKQNKD